MRTGQLTTQKTGKTMAQRGGDNLNESKRSGQK